MIDKKKHNFRENEKKKNNIKERVDNFYKRKIKYLDSCYYKNKN